MNNGLFQCDNCVGHRGKLDENCPVCFGSGLCDRDNDLYGISLEDLAEATTNVQSKLAAYESHINAIKDAWEALDVFCVCSDNTCIVCKFESVLNGGKS